MQPITVDDREQLVRYVAQWRRVIWRDVFMSIIRASGDTEFSLIQIATLSLLEEEKELTVKQVAEQLGRSVSATSRMLDQLVERGWICRREDEHDRRIKRVSITEGGRALLHSLERKRAEAQWALMEHLSPEERKIVSQAMPLLIEAARRSAHEHSEQTAEPETPDGR